ncbi:MAG: tyrosine-type recombinase/integrase [Methylomarinum sp.]|nr:tyrosine-type recombinase/integrase [Methylomarinum sp.]
MASKTKKTLSFTPARIRDLPRPEKGRIDYWDIDVPKLTCRVTAAGTKSFAVSKWNNQKQQGQRVTLGTFPDINVIEARKLAVEALSTLNRGDDPTEKKRQRKTNSTTLADTLDQYLSQRQLKPYTVKNYGYKLKLGFEPWLEKPISKITEKMIVERHQWITKNKGETTANTTFRVLRLTMNYASAVGLIGEPPTKVLSKARLWHKNKRKDRVIASDQLKSWHEAVNSLINYKAKVYLLVLLYMGVRSTEALTLEWKNVDLQKKTLNLIDTKNGTDHLLPIPEILLPELQSLHDLTSKSNWVFPGEDVKKAMTPPVKQIAIIKRESGVDFSPHDCRRTFATISEAVGLPLTMTKRLMNHVTTNDVTGGYIITEEETLRDAINKVATFIQEKIYPNPID